MWLLRFRLLSIYVSLSYDCLLCSLINLKTTAHLQHTPGGSDGFLTPTKETSVGFPALHLGLYSALAINLGINQWMAALFVSPPFRLPASEIIVTIIIIKGVSEKK